MKSYEVGYTWERKDFEHEVVASVKHENDDEIMVLLIKLRQFGSEKVEYNTMEVFVGKRYNVFIVEEETKKQVWKLNEKELKYGEAFQVFSKNIHHLGEGYAINVEEIEND